MAFYVAFDSFSSISACFRCDKLGLKIRVSVVQFRPWAPFSQSSDTYSGSARRRTGKPYRREPIGDRFRKSADVHGKLGSHGEITPLMDDELVSLLEIRRPWQLRHPFSGDKARQMINLAGLCYSSPPTCANRFGALRTNSN
jgi:hypothetical protein